MPMNRDERQMRSLPTQFRVVDENGPRIEGYFAVFGDVYELWEGATESIAPSAFEGALSDDIRALIDHETRLVLGRTKANTLELHTDSRGLWGSIRINPDDSDAMNLYRRVERGDVDQCSFGFSILRESVEVNEDGSVHWTIESVKLYEVSCVTFPAYKETSISARKDQYDQIKRREIEAWRAGLLGRMKNGS